MKRLNGHSVVVTGAGGGLGRATALALTAEGAQLALTDRDAERLEATRAAVAAQGGRVVALVGELTDPATHQQLRERALDAYGAVHGLCNVAGVLGPGTLDAVDRGSFDAVMHVNCLAPMLAIQALAPSLRATRGAIVNVASVGASAGLPLMSIYCASKAAVVGMTRAVAVELAPDVRCNVLCPGGIDTPMARGLLDTVPEADRPALLARLTGRQLLPRFAQPEEIARTLVFLVGPDSAFMTGAVVAADGGHTAW